ncbi:vesicle coat complex subunit [Enterocytozoon bieneusi H348]|nr:vesicle coat complex subunit [Enterocytozoon bieneusi H348]|eukprot:XP_002649457.1 vesicle coat complex subunit [Enterocytozoon bieneusi H348]
MNIKKITLSNLKKIADSINADNGIEYLMFLNLELEKEICVSENDQDNFIECLNIVNEKLKQYVPSKYHFYIQNNVKFTQIKERQKNNLMDIFKQTIITILLTHTMQEFHNSIEGITKTVSQDNIRIVSLCNALFRIRNQPHTPFLIQCIGYLLDKETLKEFLNFIIKLDYKRKNAEELEETFHAELLNSLDLLFLYIKFNNNDLYILLLDIVHSEKRYFKQIIIKNLPDIYIEKIFTMTRDYNFDILVSLFDMRSHLIEETIKKISNGEILIPRKSFIEKLIEYDTYFASHIKKLDLEVEELFDICNKSDAFLTYFFTTKAGSLYEFCKIFANKGEEFILKFIQKHLKNENMPYLIKSMSYTIRLTGTLKEFILKQFGNKKEYFNSLLPFLTFEQIEKRISKFYKKNITLNAFLRKFHPGDLLIEIHKLKDSIIAIKLFEETLVHEKFSNNDFIFLLKFLETASCSYKCHSCLKLFRSKSNLTKQCIVFLENISYNFQDKFYIQCLEEINTITVFESIPNTELLKLYNTYPKIKNIIQNSICSNEPLTPKMKDFIQTNNLYPKYN